MQAIRPIIIPFPGPLQMQLQLTQMFAPPHVSKYPLNYAGFESTRRDCLLVVYRLWGEEMLFAPQRAHTQPPHLLERELVHTVEKR